MLECDYMSFLSEKWINASKRLLKELKNLEETKEQDRLELVRSLRLTLYALQRSLMGWMELANNPDMLTRFAHEDLEEINKKLLQFSHAFIEYDLEATTLGTKKGLKTGMKDEKKKDRRGMFYV
jgi:hypothetical protein